jgi:hypothetical protein
MSKIGLVIILILLAGKNYAQQDYFVLIQAENKQSFYVRLGSKSFSSSAEGTLILSQLKDSTYTITIGFPGQVFPEQPFSVNLQHKDQQYLLKDQGEKGWVLYNPLTGETRSPDPKEDKGAEAQPQGIKKDDAFSRLMAGVVHDTAVMYNTYATNPITSPVTVPTQPDSTGILPTGAPARSMAVDSPIARTSGHSDTLAVANSLTAALPATPIDTTAAVAHIDKPVVQPDRQAGQPDSVLAVSPIMVAPPVTAPVDNSPAGGSSATGTDSLIKKPLGRPSVVKLSERKLPHSLRLAFSDRNPGKKADTVILFIMKDTPAVSGPRTTRGAIAGAGLLVPPPGKNLHPADTGHRISPRTNGSDASVPPVSATATANTSETPKNKPDTVQKRSSARAPLPFVNSDCHEFATDYDLDKLRVKMLEAGKDEDRIQAARKVFKTRCFSTRQIRALSEVFTTDALKFKFFETAYPFASDDHFRELANTLADPVYSSKFKAMTGQQ